MRCRPGDIAVIVLGPYSGCLVDVLYLAPRGAHTMPNGKGAFTDVSDAWVVKSKGRFFSVRVTFTQDASNAPGKRRTKYVVCQDFGLRPIRPGDGEDETLQWADVPSGVTA